MTVDPPLPQEEHVYPELPRLDVAELHRRREVVFLVCSGLFLGTLAMLNLLGVTRFLDLSFRVPGTGWTVPVHLAVGVLPYPVTFLCTDFISEIFGRARANQVVWMGLVLNVWTVLILWLGGVLPGLGPQEGNVFLEVQRLAFGSVVASMIAYLAAQFIDVQLFHFWKRLTGGRHLWLRNNGSTLVSQAVDTIAVTWIVFALGGLPLNGHEPVSTQLFVLIASGYTFKLVVALLDTIPFYIGTWALRRYLRLPPMVRAQPAHNVRPGFATITTGTEESR